MTTSPVDLRSDTVTRPTPEMKEAMMAAEVGDDVFEEDPTVNALQDKISQLFGMQDGLFVPSGTMSNQLGIKVLTEPGDEVVIESTGHVFNYETAAASHLSSVQVRPIPGHRGKLKAEDIESALRSHHDWEPRSRVVAIENTTNKGGGACYTEDELKAIREVADKHALKVHLDGARIWNAILETKINPEFFGFIGDTISVCFSKGLGAPVGSMLLADQPLIKVARRYRKMFGGGMRQVGYLAAAANYAVDHQWENMQEDHRRARELAKTIDECSGLSIDLDTVETNILIFDVVNDTALEAVEKLENEGIRMVPFGPQTLRATFHLQVDDDDLERAQKALKKVYG